jgi:flagellar biosynthesis protein FlhF
MQVKKFEAKTMREALQMVKSELGPEAIILSAKDIKRGYGLAGGTGVELTAAISEQKFKERQYALKKLKEDTKKQMLEAPAKMQKQFIEKSLRQYLEEKQQNPVLPSRRQYIQINDETETPKMNVKPVPQTPAQQATQQAENNAIRVKTAAYSAAKVFDKDFKEVRKVAPNVKAITAKSVANAMAQTPALTNVMPARSNAEVVQLQQEIQRLQSVIEGFQKLPQTFVGTHPGADYGLPYELSFMFEKLTDSGLNREHAAQILDKAKESMPAMQMKKKAMVEAWTAKYILDSIKVSGDKVQSKIEVFIGGSGAGKTSTLVKYASYQLIVNRKSVAIISTDSNKVGATEQLKIYAQILNVPFAAIRSQEEWDLVLQRLNGIDVILVDTPGVSLKDLNEIDSIKNKLQPIQEKSRIHYVLSSASNEAAALDLAKRFKIFHYNDLIFTKLDECSHHGMLYSMSEKLESPLHSFGIGAHIPEDYEFATRERVLDLIFKITKKG